MAEMQPAGPGERVIAHLIDLSPYVVVQVLMISMNPRGAAEVVFGILALVAFVHPVLWRIAGMDTPGKQITATTVVSARTGERVGFFRFLWRWFFYWFVPAVVAGVTIVVVVTGAVALGSDEEGWGPLLYLVLGFILALAVAALLALLWPVLQLIMVSTRRDGAALHDLVSGTRVVKVDSGRRREEANTPLSEPAATPFGRNPLVADSDRER